MKLNQTIVFISLLLLTSCGLKPITSEYAFVKTDFEKIELEKLGNGNILIYNGANVFHKIDNTARLNVWIDDKPLGQIKPNEYVIINMKNGKYTFKVLHKDVVNMRSEHVVDINEQTKIIKIKPNITSNKLEVTNELPENFGKFSYAEKS
ncbi:hypothetical protein [Psychroserpens luteus]|uniref:DUF2846 domain-containing protein n=1 Tax=Psychroserpens luteus TaxID=1434066 RepID=A0ABW5ZNH8_9FLAO|nr:hypothetical protein [Psychroserpens luteus]